MAIITDADVQGPDGRRVPGDCHGNNAAVECPNPECKHPVLLIARTHHRGSGRDRPIICRQCGTSVWIASTVDAGIRVNPVRIDYATND